MNKLILVFLFLVLDVFPQDAHTRLFRGKIVDQTGAVIRTASVQLDSGDGRTTFCQSKSDGGFVCEIKFEGDFLLTVNAEGFSILRQEIPGTQDTASEMILTLRPTPLSEEVYVTANRGQTRLGETAVSVISLSKDEMKSASAPVIDDMLRQVPGFSLFRRSGSRSANPTVQGVSLRGVGASGAGRSLVLFDDIPLNDPFGGWTQWSRIPPLAVERIEVLRGGASSLYGNDSLSGAVNVIPRRAAEELGFSAEIYGGIQRTFSASAYLGFKRKDWSVDLVAALLHNRGYVPVDPGNRGAADYFAGARNSNLSLRAEKKFGDKANVFAKAAYFGEARQNGTRLQNNRTHIRQFAAGGEFEFPNPNSKIHNPKLNWLFYGGTQVFDQTFSAVSEDRGTENLVRVQRVPAQVFGFKIRFSTVFAKHHTFVSGFETKEVRGASNETGFFGGRAASQSGAGGRQRTTGLFAQDLVRLSSRVILAGSVRYDHWKNFRALNSLNVFSTNQTVATIFDDRTESSLTASGSVLFQATGKLSFHAVGSNSFRAPTLNELYRGFRVGNIVTDPNKDLRAERAASFDAGASYATAGLFLRGNLFFSRISDPVGNVTLTASPNLIVRQRQNMGSTRAIGIELDAEKRWRKFSFSAGYLLSDSRVTEFPADRMLEGRRVPLVSRHHMTFGARFADKRGWTVALQGRASSGQFDDDLNELRLEPYFQLDVFGAKRIREKYQVFIAAENVFNARYSIGRTPVRTIGSPVTGRIGIRWN